jgi:hypothetical protein
MVRSDETALRGMSWCFMTFLTTSPKNFSLAASVWQSRRRLSGWISAAAVSA